MPTIRLVALLALTTTLSTGVLNVARKDVLVGSA